MRDGGIGWLGGATTIGRFRERGVQGALVRERMVAAQASGCDLAVATAMPGRRARPATCRGSDSHSPTARP